MKKEITLLLTTLMLTYIPATASDSLDSRKGNCSIGTSAFILFNLIPKQKNPPGFFQFNFGYWLSDKDVLSLEFITWKYGEPIGIPYGSSKGSLEAAYPGTVRDWGVGIAYQRFLWKGVYLAQHITPLIQKYELPDNQESKGFMLFMATRIGYHVPIKKHFFIEPSVALTYWPVKTEVPHEYKIHDDKWPGYIFEPGFHLGFIF